jgi:hypothetical protein
LIDDHTSPVKRIKSARKSLFPIRAALRATATNEGLAPNDDKSGRRQIDKLLIQLAQSLDFLAGSEF